MTRGYVHSKEVAYDNATHDILGAANEAYGYFGVVMALYYLTAKPVILLKNVKYNQLRLNVCRRPS